MLTEASVEARTGAALCCAKAAPSSKCKPAEKPNSWFAAGFLSLYVAVYLAAGFVGVAAIEWIWTKLFA